MDKLLYISMSGAKQNLTGIAMNANNLANTKTVGFKSDFAQARSMQAFGEGLPTRIFAMQERPGSNMTGGHLKTTGRDLDIAISGNGWLSVRDEQGKEALTKAGNLKITATGELLTSRGNAVMGQGGPIVLPVPLEKVEIGADGSVVVRPQGAPANFLETVDLLKLVEVEGKNQLTKGNDGLFRSKQELLGEQCGFCEASPNVRVIKGVLEGSNVNPILEMTQMISHQRQFEMQVKMMSKAEEMGQRHDSLLRIV